MSVREFLHIDLFILKPHSSRLYSLVFLSSLIIHHENIRTLVILLSCARTVLFILCILCTHWQTPLDVTAHALIFDLTHVFDWSVINIIGLLCMSIKRDALNLARASPRLTAHYHTLVILISCGWVWLLSGHLLSIFPCFILNFIVYK